MPINSKSAVQLRVQRQHAEDVFLSRMKEASARPVNQTYVVKMKDTGKVVKSDFTMEQFIRWAGNACRLYSLEAE